MAKKRVTLPKNFDELITSGNIEALKAVYEKCELSAYSGKYSLNTALHYGGVPDEIVVWLVEQGLDVNVVNYYGRTPLYKHATMGRETVKLLFKLGGDIEKPDEYGNTPLHTAAEFFHPDTVHFLLEKGANVHVKNDMGRTPLACTLAACRNINIVQAAEISEMLIKEGAEVTSGMAERVEQIGSDFEFHREKFNKDYLAETEAGLEKLYALFDVKPVPKHKRHDGVSPIIVKEGSWKEQFDELWDMLIPSSGAAKTVQGEVIRITGRVQDELYRNGGVNWDKSYRNMLRALPNHFASGTPLSKRELEETKELISSIRTNGDDEETITERLCELSVLWVLLNRDPIPLGETSYDR